MRVPRISATTRPAGIMVLEDLGDLHLRAGAEGAPIARSCTRKAMDLLARLRAHAERTPGPGLPRLHARLRLRPLPLGARPLPRVGPRGRGAEVPSDAELQQAPRPLRATSPASWPLRRAASPTATTRAATSWCCPHGELVVIDFQDALQGPRQYDLVALLRDSYVELDRAFVERDARPLPRAPRRPGRRSARPPARSGASSTCSPSSASSRTPAASSSSTA